MDAAIDLTPEKSGGFENAQMLGDGRQGDFGRGGQLADGGFALGETSKDGAAGGIGEGPEGGVERRGGIVNHMV